MMKGKKDEATFCVDPQFKELLPRLSPDERQRLKAQIAREGRCISPLVIWREEKILIDGHHREELVRELRQEGVDVEPPRLVYRSFDSRYAAIRWMFHFQNARRNWTPAERAASVLSNRELVEQLKTDAKKRKWAGKKLDLPARGSGGGDSRRFLARLAGVGEGTISRVEKVINSGDKEVIRKLLVARSLSAREAHALVIVAERRKRLELRAAGARNELPPLKRSGDQLVNQIVHADALEALAKVKPDSVALAFTSPPYPLQAVSYSNFFYAGSYRKHLEWLQAVWTAVARTLKDGGRLVVNVDATGNREHETANEDVLHPIYAEIVNQMRAVGLKFYGEVCWYKQRTAGRKPNWGTYCSCRSPRIRRNHEYILIFCKGPAFLAGDPKLCDLTPDEFQNWTISHWYLRPERRKHDGHPAPFPESLAERVVRLLTYVGDTVLDPFCGSGTVPFVAKKFGRRFIGIDNAESYVASAKRRILTLSDVGPKTRRSLGRPARCEA